MLRRQGDLRAAAGPCVQQVSEAVLWVGAAVVQVLHPPTPPSAHFSHTQMHLKPSASYCDLIVKRGCLINRYDHPLYSEEGARKPKSGNPGGRRSMKAAENTHMQMANLITTMGCLLCSSWKPTLSHKNAKIMQQAMWQNRALCIHSQLGVLFCCHQMLPRTLHNRNGISRNNKNLSKHKTMA